MTDASDDLRDEEENRELDLWNHYHSGGEMTQRDALIACWELWSWLAENPGHIKQEWPGWDDPSWGWPKRMYEYSFCPCCCQAGHRRRLKDCNNCLLYDFWTEAGIKQWEPCVQEKSPFRVWMEHHSSEPAWEIADAAWNELNYRGLI